MKKSSIALFAFLTLLAAAAPLHAQDAVEPEPIAEPGDDPFAPPAKPISAALLLGFGTTIGEDANFYGVGIGVRGGYNLGRLYLGGRFVYHLGGSDEVVTGGFNTLEVDYNVWLLGAEAGYDFLVADRFTVRPGVILGIANFSASSDGAVFGAGLSESDTKLLFSLVGSGFYDITPDIFLGGELQFPIALGGESVVGLIINATGGMRF